MDENQGKSKYKDMVSIIVDEFLHDTEKSIKLDFKYVNEEAATAKLGDDLSGSKAFIVTAAVASLDELRKNITKNSENFEVIIPNEYQWKLIFKYFEIPSSKITLENMGALDNFSAAGTMLLGAGIGSVIPGIGTLVGGAVGAGIGFLRGLKKSGHYSSENQEKIKVIKQNVMQHLGEQRQRVIDAILAYSY